MNQRRRDGDIIHSVARSKVANLCTCQYVVPEVVGWLTSGNRTTPPILKGLQHKHYTTDGIAGQDQFHLTVFFVSPVAWQWNSQRKSVRWKANLFAEETCWSVSYTKNCFFHSLHTLAPIPARWRKESVLPVIWTPDIWTHLLYHIRNLHAFSVLYTVYVLYLWQLNLKYCL